MKEFLKKDSQIFHDVVMHIITVNQDASVNQIYQQSIMVGQTL